ncbi:MAG: 4-hydroxy-3-methylbut-2-enyl diphosphate reductase [Chloroflexi bacterium]|nr:4-hydroxy-3-methylbut-2-enyl diphosphate reductase [Chloroflexota bacterium]
MKLAKQMGFCFGVRRGITLAERVAKERGPVQTLGAIVHNRQVVDRLAEMNVGVAHSLDEVEANRVIIATHGVPRTVMDEARQRGLEIVDATCPYVRAIQEKARKMHEAGFQVVVFGDRGHTEVVGIVGWTDGQAMVAGDADDLATLRLSRKVGVVAQTTQSIMDYEALIARLTAQHLAACLELRVHNTICNATAERQAAALDLAESTEVVIVVGGRDSANTRRLVELCHGKGVPTYHVESAAEIASSWLTGHSLIGVTAGASTPDWVIQEVIEKIEAFEPGGV